MLFSSWSRCSRFPRLWSLHFWSRRLWSRRLPIAGLVSSIGRWLANARGNVAVTVALSTPAVIMLIGVSADYARAEHVRAKMQHAVDMAALALAKMNDDYDDPQAAARRFITATLEAAAIDVSKLDSTVRVVKTMNTKAAEVSATLSPNLLFASYFTTKHFNVSAVSRAEERFRHLEISMVLDISGSMRNAKIRNLRNAATEFVEIMLKSEHDADYTSINVIPFGGDVAVGKSFDKFLKSSQRAGWNGCIDLDTRALRGQVLPVGAQDATPELKFGAAYVCPRSWNSALFRENNLEALKKKIAGLRALGPSTSTDMGAYWGLSALTPDWRPHLPGAVTDAPRKAGDEVQKTLIIMTDGAINAPYRQVRGAVRKIYSTSFGADRLRDVCVAAKAEGIAVFTIGFEVRNAWMNNLLRDCASGPEYFFDPSGTEISDVFQTIAFRLTPLRLIN